MIKYNVKNGYYNEVLTFDGDHVNGDRYTIKGNKLHFDDWADYEDVWPTVNVKGNILTLVYDLVVDGYEAIVTFNYKRNSSRTAVLRDHGSAMFKTLINRYH